MGECSAFLGGKMNTINFIPEIVTGKDSLNRLKYYKKKRFLIVTDSFIRSTEVFKNTVNMIKLNNKVNIFSDIVPDPPIETIVAGIEVFNAANPEVVLSIGGGSAIDAAKAILYFAIQADVEKDRDGYEFIVIPTTSGTGSEVTTFAVITDLEKGTKYPLVEKELLPDLSILTTEFLKDLPKHIIADTGIDALTHAIEAYVSTKSTIFSDALAEKAIRLILENIVRSSNTKVVDIKAREKMHEASTIAGLAFNVASLGINHSLAHALGGEFHKVHGRLNGTLLKNVILFNSGMLGNENTKDWDTAKVKYRELSKLFGITIKNDKIAITQLVQKITKLLKDLDMPTTLKEHGIEEKLFLERLDKIVAAALSDRCTPTNPRKPTKENLIDILKASF